MTQGSIPKAYAEALQCPSCESLRLIPTKEKIIICQDCLTGYRVTNGVPDFRLEHAMSFRNRLNQKKTGLHASLTTVMGENKEQSVEVKYGHCVILGRLVNPSVNLDVTVVLKPVSQLTYSHLDPNNQQLIEKYLSRGQSGTQVRDVGLGAKGKLLGNFTRDPDFLINDPSISRTHAVIYQDDQGLNVLDLYSKNGTYVNGYEVESCRLRHNDLISLGTASLKVSLY